MANKPAGKRHSACANHVGLAVADMSGRVCRVINVQGHPRDEGRATYTCSCGEPAYWFFIEQVDDQAK